jgi:peptidoglycan/LPS O-acetylase OafA/YrhL
LSGFLITSILITEFETTEKINYKKFYIRRFLRLMPAYWLHLAVLYFFAFRLFSAEAANQLHSNDNFFYAFTYLTNYHRAWHGSEVPGLLNHTWSLAIEEQFYIFAPAFFFQMWRQIKQRRAIIFVVTSLILFFKAYRAFSWQGADSAHYLYNAFEMRVDALLVGCQAALIVAWRCLPEKFLRSSLFDLTALCSLLTLFLILFNLPDSYMTAYLYQGGFTIFALATGVLIVWLATRKSGRIHRILEWKPFVWLGKTSYGLYLWHSAALMFVYPLALAPAVKLLLAAALTLTVTAVSYYLMELRFLRLKNKFAAH